MAPRACARPRAPKGRREVTALATHKPLSDADEMRVAFNAYLKARTTICAGPAGNYSVDRETRSSLRRAFVAGWRAATRGRVSR